MKIVITGGTRGIGFAMARRFLSWGHSVVISGTSDKSAEAAIEKFNSKKVFGCSCLVENYKEVRKLYAFAYEKMGGIDIWINNAGINQPNKLFHELNSDEYKKVIDVDIVGLINGTNVAFSGMLKQGHGYIYNMEGLGSDGRIIPKSIIYGTAKRAVRYFSKAAAKECVNTCVCIGRLSPGMVLTEFLLKDVAEDTSENNQTKKIFNILADEPETVTAYLSKRIIKNTKNNVYIAWLTTPKILFRFLTAFRRKNKFFKIN